MTSYYDDDGEDSVIPVLGRRKVKWFTQGKLKEKVEDPRFSS